MRPIDVAGLLSIVLHSMPTLTTLKILVAALALAAAGATACAAPAIPRAELERKPMRLLAVFGGGKALELEALAVKPAAEGRYPLALITHGSPRQSEERRRMSAARMSFQAEELARRGYFALVVMRRGYGTSEGSFHESSGRCDSADHERAALESARDLRAALRTLASHPQVDATRAIVIGQSAGGIGAMALAADPPPGLKAVVNFAGGRGSRAPNEVCREDRLIEAYAAFGKAARVPSLWIYTENDRYFGPELARRMFAAYRAQGGAGELRLLPAFAEDGHALFARRSGVPQWRPLLDAFLRSHDLPTWDAPPAEPALAQLPPPPALAGQHLQHWQRYLEAADDKAFAISPSGRFAWRSGRYTPGAAGTEALAACGLQSCRLYAQNDALVSGTLVSR